MATDALVTLGAVALGGGIAAGTQLLNDLVQSRRSKRARSHAVREALYAEFCDHVFALTDGMKRIAKARLHDDRTLFDFPLEAWAVQRDALLSRMNLVASREVLAAARDVSAILAAISHGLNAGAHLSMAISQDLDGEEHQELVNFLRESQGRIVGMQAAIGGEADEAYADMINAMRLDLGNGKIRGPFPFVPEHHYDQDDDEDDD